LAGILDTKIGIIGGGQLGKMMAQDTKKMGFHLTVLDPEANCPAHSLCDRHVVADLYERRTYREMAETCDVLTYEFEHIDAEYLLTLENEGCRVYPTAKNLINIQDKLTQKRMLQEGGAPVPEFTPLDKKNDIFAAGEKWGYPVMLKTRRGGYDGKGNAAAERPEQVEEALNSLLPEGGNINEIFVEKWVQYDMEASVLACRGLDGAIAVYPLAKNLHEDSILRSTAAPAGVSPLIAENSRRIGEMVTEIFGGIGMFCIEMFVTKDGLLVNEVAPRPHNSGHYTIEACYTSQFENHVRAVTGLPLGSPHMKTAAAVMTNIISPPFFSGAYRVSGAEKALGLQGVTLHMYGKQTARPKRKMGHITVVGNDLNEVRKTAEEAASYITLVKD